MTGQGQGRIQCGSTDIAVEVRAVNNRHLKLSLRTSDGLGVLEPQIEAVVRGALRRGSLQLNVQATGGALQSDYRLQASVIEGYWNQCQEIGQRLNIAQTITWGDLLALPGTVIDPRGQGERKAPSEELAQGTLAAVQQALDSLNAMRLAEGESMGVELSRQLENLRAIVNLIEERAPQVVAEYRTRLTTKLTAALAEIGGHLPEGDVVREVLLMADKADIREEIVRLRSHFSQFEQLLGAAESPGRKLDFLIQELFRETNTIGSKANDADVAQRVVDMKTTIEQMRELVQNVE